MVDKVTAISVTYLLHDGWGVFTFTLLALSLFSLHNRDEAAYVHIVNLPFMSWQSIIWRITNNYTLVKIAFFVFVWCWMDLYENDSIRWNHYVSQLSLIKHSCAIWSLSSWSATYHAFHDLKKNVNNVIWLLDVSIFWGRSIKMNPGIICDILVSCD